MGERGIPFRHSAAFLMRSFNPCKKASMNHVGNEAVVFRQVAFPVSAFDHLKDYLRNYEHKHGVRITNSQALALILAEHKQAAAAGLLVTLGGAA